MPHVTRFHVTLSPPILASELRRIITGAWVPTFQAQGYLRSDMDKNELPLTSNKVLNHISKTHPSHLFNGIVLTPKEKEMLKRWYSFQGWDMLYPVVQIPWKPMAEIEQLRRELPKPMFLWGSLADLSFLSEHVLKKNVELIQSVEAHVEGFQVRRRRPGEGGDGENGVNDDGDGTYERMKMIRGHRWEKVRGRALKIEQESDVERMAEWVGEGLVTEKVKVVSRKGEAMDGWTFVWRWP
ncbi:MAG: hypothetical protein LQ351_004701 [Letrouitia transgressa]|nr:MAG: hypothetical protein LQ351_004701 [Letrouitia transgressa]